MATAQAKPATPPAKGATPPPKAASPPTRPGMGFRKVSGEQIGRRRMVVSIYGPEKSGKNHFAFTAPGPFGFHSFDYGDEGVIEKFVRGEVEGVPPMDVDKAEYVLNVPPDSSVDETSKAATPVWSAFTTNYAIGLAKYRTSVIDTGTDAYEIVRMSYFGKLSQVMPHHYAPVNAEFKGLFRQAYSTVGHNLILLNRHKDEWLTKIVNGKEKADRTGNMIFAGYSGTPYEVQVHLRSFKSAGEFGMEVVACRQNPNLEGMELSGDMLNWWTLGQLVFPGSEEEEWR